MKEGNFELKFYQMIDEKLFGLVRGHFGTVNTCAIHPDGGSFCSGYLRQIEINFYSNLYFLISPSINAEVKMVSFVCIISTLLTFASREKLKANSSEQLVDEDGKMLQIKQNKIWQYSKHYSMRFYQV